jgi:hypothetical protein
MLVPPTTMAVFNDSRDLLKAWTCQKVKQHMDKEPKKNDNKRGDS